MARVVLVLAALLCHTAAEFESQTCTRNLQATIQPGAEAMLGGILPVQGKGADGYGCAASSDTMQWYEALRYALDLVNKKDEFLNGQYLDDYYVPGVRLGMQVMDNCENTDQGVAAISSIFPSLSADARSCQQKANITLGIVTGTSSGTSGQVSVFANQYDIPVVSFTSTAPDLTFSGNYPNFLRTIPPDSGLLTVMGAVLTKLQWRFVVVVYENSAYGREAYSALRPVLGEAGICLTAAFMASGDDLAPSTMQSLLGQVVDTDTVGTIYLGGMSLIDALLKEGPKVTGAKTLQWIVTDSIPLDTTFDFSYPNGVIAIVPASRYIVEFEDHWVRINESSPSSENPWYQGWYMNHYRCDLTGYSTFGTPCSSIFQGLTAQQIERKKRLEFVQDQFVEPAVHAVFTYAYALREAQQALCTSRTGICSELASLSHKDFLNNYLKKVNFTYAARERVPSLASDQYAPYKAAKKLKFDSRGDIVNPAFSVWNYNNLPIGEEDSTIFKFREVGNYINQRLTINMDNIRMYAEDRVTPLLPIPSSPCPAQDCSPCVEVPGKMKYYFQNGDIVINGIFSLHQRGLTKYSCGDLLSNVHPLYLQAMIYAVKQVNLDPSVLPGVTVGGLGIDDCMDSDLSTNFLTQVQTGQYTVRDDSGSSLDPWRVEAYTAAYNTPLSIPLAYLMNIFQKPMVGYRAASSYLDRYKYYLKTVPSLQDEFRAIIMLMKSVHWNYTQVLYSTDAYSQDDVTLFRSLAAQAGICVVADYLFDGDHPSALGMLAQHSSVRPVVLLLSAHNHRQLLQELNRTFPSPHPYQFIATSTLGADAYLTAGFQAQAEGIISIDNAYSSLTRFYSSLDVLRVDSYRDNPWFQEWFESAFNCSVGGSGQVQGQGGRAPCSNAVGITSAPGFVRDRRVVHVINAVYAIARGLHSVLTKYCGAGYRGVCPTFVNAGFENKGEDMVQEILKVTFPIEDTNPVQTFSFSGRGGAYTFRVHRFHAGAFTQVGTVTPYQYSVSEALRTTVNSTVPSSCPKPCVECLYMFAFQQYWYLDGDLIIPAVFDIHYRGNSMYTCGPLRVSNGVQYTEAFKYALDRVNGGGLEGVNLTNVRLGGLAFDGCSSPARAMAIVNGVMGRTFPVLDHEGDRVDVTKLVSWLTYDSESTMEAADMLKMVGMPIVSPGATAPQLLDKTRYSTFFRTVPSDTVVARAMASFIQDQGWKYVITLNAPDAGSRETRDRFRDYLKDMGICVIANLEFETDGSVDIILSSINDSTTQVVAVFADPDQYVEGMLQRKEDLYPNNNVIFIANRFWDLQHMKLRGTPPTIPNSISFRRVNPTVADFVTYLEGLTIAGSDNPWLVEYYQALYRCDLAGSRVYGTACASVSMDLRSSGNVYQHVYSISTINAVHSLAVALSKVLEEKCGVGYSGVCGRFLTDSNSLQRMMTLMDERTFRDVAGKLFDFVQREVNPGLEVLRHTRRNTAQMVATVSADGNMTYLNTWVPGEYIHVKSECTDGCLLCEGIDANFKNFTFIPGDLYIVGLFDVHTEGSTPYTCGGLNQRQGLQLLEAFHYAIDYMNQKRGNFSGRLNSVKIGGVGIDVCRSPSRAANLVANLHSGNLRLTLSGGLEINRRDILAYVGPFTTASTIRVADILNAIGVPQVTYGATGLELQDPVRYHYLLRSVPADDKQSRAIISYLKNFNLTNVQVVTSRETVGLTMTREFMRLATLNLVCIHNNYTLGDKPHLPISMQAEGIVRDIVAASQSQVVVLLVKDPLPILQAAGRNTDARENVLWIATDKWGYDIDFLHKLQPLLGDRNSRKNVIIFDVETADVPDFDLYLEDKTPSNYSRDPWFREYYEAQIGCRSPVSASICQQRGLSRQDDYIQDPYVLYVVNAVWSVGLGIDGALRAVCNTTEGLCPKFVVTGDRRDIVLDHIRQVRFKDDTKQPFYYESTGESSRGYHIYNVTKNYDGILDGNYMFENVGSYNDTDFLKLDITYDLPYQAYCIPYESCVCVNPFPQHFPSRYMPKPSPLELNLVYIGDIHQRSPSDPFACSSINLGTDFFKMMAFFYAIDRVNGNLDNRYPESLRLGGIALDTCSSTLRLEQDVFNLLSGYPLCDTGKTAQVMPPSSVVAFVPDGNANSLAVSSILAATGITSVSPSAMSPKLRDLTMSQHFLSVVPPHDVMATALLQLMQKMNWDYASVIYTIDPSMEDAQKELLRQSAVDQSACIGQAVPLPLNADVSAAEVALDRVSQQVGSRAVILFTLPAHTRLLLQAAKKRGRPDSFVWVVTTGWGHDNWVLQGLEEQAGGALVVRPYATAVEDFRSFVTSLTFTQRQGIPDDWFEEIYQSIHRCKIHNARRPLPFPSLCDKTERITDDMVPYEPSVLHTIIAVYMVAQGLNKIPDCQGSNLDISACITRLQNRNDAIYQAILTAQWNVLPALLGDQSFSFTFSPQGYGNIGLDILNYHSTPSGDGFTYTKLGRYTDSLQFNSLNYQGLSSYYEPGVIPVSRCLGNECNCQGPRGIYGVADEWTLVPGLTGTEVVEEGRTYQDPATKEFFYVEKIPDVSSRFRDMWGVAVTTLAALGVVVSLALFLYLLVVYPVRGGTSVLGYVLAFGIILLYALVFAFVAHANPQICGLRRFCLGFCYAICYSALFVKLVDCWRSREKEDMFEVKYNKLGRPFGLFMVVVMLVLVQVMINAEWLILEEPKVVRIFYNDQYWPRCTPDDFYDQGLVLSLCYIMVIILLTVCLGFCTFNSTKNHREARWILGMSILAVPTWVVWCAWASLGAVKTRDAAVAVGLLLNATVLLLLGPVRKLYLLHRYQALVQTEASMKLQQEHNNTGPDYGTYENQYDNAPQFHDRASTVGSTGAPYRYAPSSVHSARY
ncbi:uncharacterized protein LOC143274691 [Babylonia areolata]|uniref:uncharacterized protein LOC143274691 n=1 Tax=Babylonia areolata TaxID=304850 RepID=UPI003FD25982